MSPLTRISPSSGEQDTAALIAEARRVREIEARNDWCTPGCPRGEHEHGVSLVGRLADALEAVTAERDGLAAVIEKARTEVDGTEWTELSWRQSHDRVSRILASAPGDVLREHDAKVAAGALEDAARDIPQEGRRDECFMHDVFRVDQLPEPSQNMLNGYTRFAERLRSRAAAIREVSS